MIGLGACYNYKGSLRAPPPLQRCCCSCWGKGCPSLFPSVLLVLQGEGQSFPLVAAATAAGRVAVPPPHKLVATAAAGENILSLNNLPSLLHAAVWHCQRCQGWLTQMRVIFSLAPPSNTKYREWEILKCGSVTPLELINTNFGRRMRVGWPKCGSDPRDEGHLVCLHCHGVRQFASCCWG